jgi:predicted RNA-binding Zn-ribbon protein involved in translation (DUF1610 family)
VATGYTAAMAPLSVTTFNVAHRCPVCGGDANARYRGPDTLALPRRRKCMDCGFTWDEGPQSPPSGPPQVWSGRWRRKVPVDRLTTRPFSS